MLDHTLLFLPLVISTLLVSIRKFSLRTTQVVYITFGLLWILEHYFIFDTNIYTPIAIVIIGEILHFVLVGLFGKNLPTNVYTAALLGVGLFPWLDNLVFSFVYVCIFVVCSGFLAFLKKKEAIENYGLSSFASKNMQTTLGESEYRNYMKNMLSELLTGVIVSGISVMFLGYFV